MDGYEEIAMAKLFNKRWTGFRLFTIIFFLLLGLLLFPASDVFAVPTETGDKCFDGRDNDRDGLIDADDPDCRDPETPTASETWVIVDSAIPPKTVGAVIGTSWPAVDIIFDLDGTPVSARVTKDGFYFDTSYHNLPDCSYNPPTFSYVSGSNHNLLIEHVYIHPDPDTGAMALWVRDPDSNPFVGTIYGVISAETFGECKTVSATDPAYQNIRRVPGIMLGIYDLHQMFPPPFSLVKK